MKYLYTLSSYILLKFNKQNQSANHFYKSLSKNIGSSEPSLSLFLRRNQYNYLLKSLELDESLDLTYKNTLIAKVFAHQQDYSAAFNQIKDLTHPNILSQKIKYAYTIRNTDYLETLLDDKIDVFNYLSIKQKRTLIEYLTFHNNEELCIKFINNSKENREELFLYMKNSSKNTLAQYKWNPFREKYLSISTEPSREDIQNAFLKLDQLNENYKNIGHVHLINNFYTRDDLKDLLENVSVPTINKVPTYFRYIDRKAFEVFNFNFEFEKENNDLLTFYLENYETHPKQTVDYFINSLSYLPNRNVYSYFLNKALNDELINIKNKSLQEWIERADINLSVLYDSKLFTNKAINSEISSYVNNNLSSKQQKIVFEEVISQMVQDNDLYKLPEHLVSFLEDNSGKLVNLIVLFKHYIATKKDYYEFIKKVSPDSMLKVYLYFAKLFFQKNDIENSLQMTEKASSISSINYQVLRNYIRIYHFIGDITNRFEYIKKMKEHFPNKLYGNEYEMAEQEFELFTNSSWKPFVDNINIKNKLANNTNNKVMYVLNKAYPSLNGYTVRSDEIIQTMHKMNFDPVIVTKLGWSPVLDGHEKPEKYKDTFPVYYIDHADEYIPFKTPIKDYFQKYTEELLQIIKKESPDIIYAASNFQNALPSLVIAQELKIPSVYEVRGMWQYTQSTKNSHFMNSERFTLHEQYEIECCKIADQVTCICESLKTFLINRGVDASKITIISNGVNSSDLVPLRKDLQIIKDYNLVDKIVVGFVGSITAYEGLDYLLKAIKKINEEKLYNKEFLLLIVGDGSFKNNIETLSKQLNIEKYVKLVGRVSREDVPRFYSVIDIAPFPRIDIDLCQLVTPLKPYEAMSFEKKIIVSDVDALKEMVIPSVNGQIFKANDVTSLSNTLVEVVENNDLAKKAREWVKNNKDWTVIGKQLELVFNKVIEFHK